MSTAALHWQLETDGIRFRVEDREGRAIAPWQWGLYDLQVAGRPASAAALLGLLEDGLAEPAADSSLPVPHARVAAFDDVQIRQLGLPPVAPYRLHIRGQGILTSPRFRFLFQLTGHDGRPVPGLRREGVLLTVRSSRYTLLDPVYTLVEGMDAFNALPLEDLDGRFLRWADLKALLPEDAQVDQHLRSLNVVRADAFTLDLDDAGSFDPQLLARPRGDSGQVGDDPVHSEPVLPEAPQQAFRSRFRGFKHAQARYATGSNWFVVVPEPLRRALDVVREFQDMPLSQRQAFIANPQAVLRERLQDDLGEAVLDSLFEETPAFVSERVLRLGQWQPKLCAYVIPTGQKWLPPEEQVLGVPLGDGVYTIPAKDLPALKAAVEAALSEGRKAVEWQGQAIPATEETLAFLGQTLDQAGSGGTAPATKNEKPAGPADSVPVLIDNLDEIGFTAQRRPVHGTAGGIPGLLAACGLYDHQIQGLHWLQEHWVSGSPGALLADDMGLGKTLQTLAYLAWVQEQIAAGHHPRCPFLVIAPTGLLKIWEDEASTHLVSPGLGRLFRAYGPSLQALNRLTHRQRLQRLQDADWVLTTYETLRDRIRYFIGLEWGVAVFDEAQKIKNPASRLTEMAKSIKADFQLMLTGTPVENRLADLWSIVDAAAPGVLGSLKDFHQHFEKPAVADPDALIPLKARLTEQTRPPLMLRRLKADHLKGLPAKRQKLIRVTMSPAQADAYARQVAKAGVARGNRGAMLEILQGRLMN